MPLPTCIMKCNVYYLTCVTFVCGGVTICALCLAVSTDYWLHTRELITPEDGNGTKFLDSKMWIATRSGLWKICIIIVLPGLEGDQELVNCGPIVYTVEDGSGRDGGADTSMIIVTSIRKSVPLPVAALLLSLIAFIFNVMGSIHRDVKTLTAAVCYVLSGLALAVGIILYISSINDEVGFRSNTRKDEDGFYYSYGWSFYSAGTAFISSEMAAVVCVTLYLRRNQRVEDMIKIIPGLKDKVDAETGDSDGFNNPTIIL